MNILVTGCAGFIGFHLCKSLLKNHNVVGIDNLNNYYDVGLKKDRLKILKSEKKFKFFKIDIANNTLLEQKIKNKKIKYIVNLAAQAGVRYSLQNPREYMRTNLIGFFNILELAKKLKVKHLISASTSSVYGDSKKIPMSEEDSTDRPIQFYAATKKSNEVMGRSYSYLYKIPITMTRFFTVYGPWGRPDMALFKFTNLILENKVLPVFNNGNHSRSFSYIGDVIFSINCLINKPPKEHTPFRILNIGNNKKQKLLKYISIIEKNLKKKAKKKYLKLQLGDIKDTQADIRKLKRLVPNYKNTKIEKGIKLFVDWYKSYY